MENFEKALLETLARQLINGYSITDNQGYTREVTSPLQSILTKYFEENKEIFINAIGEIFKDKEWIKQGVAEKIEKDLSDKYTLGRYQNMFVQHFKELVEEEVTKDLKVLFKDKKIIVEIKDN